MNIQTGQRWAFHYSVNGTDINELFIVEILDEPERSKIVQVVSSKLWKVGDEFGHSIPTEYSWTLLSGQDTP